MRFSRYAQKIGRLFWWHLDRRSRRLHRFLTYPLDIGSIKSMVEYRFNLLDAYVDTSGMATFLVAQEPVKEKFQEFLRDLANHGLTGRIRKSWGQACYFGISETES